MSPVSHHLGSLPHVGSLPRQRSCFAQGVSFCFAVLIGTQAMALDWSGYQWTVRDTKGQKSGPHQNIFTDDSKSVFVDDNGDLHLVIRQDENGVWTAAELMTVQSLGYGTYEWELSCRYDQFAPEVVLGLFTYNSPKTVAERQGGKIGDGKPDTPHEIDIEMTGSWGTPNLFFTTHDPDVQSPGISFFQLLEGTHTTHRFHWTAKKIAWESFHGHVAGQDKPATPIVETREGENKGKVAAFVYEGPVVPKHDNEKLHMNFWLFNNDKGGDGPSGGQTQEAIIHSFRFTPAPE